jgi:ABC-type sugar transport system substrate-binding protein
MVRSMRIMFLLSALACVCAGTAASASAAEWHVNEKTFTGTKKIAEKTNVIEPFTLTAAGVTITCKTLTVKGGFIEESNKNGAEHLVFGECKVTTGTACSVAATLETKAVKSTAELGKIIFSPKEGTNFITIEFKGAECALKGNKEVTGKVTTTTPTGEKEEEEQEIVADSINELKVGTNNATFQGKVKVKLEPAEKFSFH